MLGVRFQEGVDRSTDAQALVKQWLREAFWRKFRQAA
jgi:hypothetical protein